MFLTRPGEFASRLDCCVFSGRYGSKSAGTCQDEPAPPGRRGRLAAEKRPDSSRWLVAAVGRPGLLPGPQRVGAPGRRGGGKRSGGRGVGPGQRLRLAGAGRGQALRIAEWIRGEPHGPSGGGRSATSRIRDGRPGRFLHRGGIARPGFTRAQPFAAPPEHFGFAGRTGERRLPCAVSADAAPPAGALELPSSGSVVSPSVDSPSLASSWNSSPPFISSAGDGSASGVASGVGSADGFSVGLLVGLLGGVAFSSGNKSCRSSCWARLRPLHFRRQSRLATRQRRSLIRLVTGTRQAREVRSVGRGEFLATFRGSRGCRRGHRFGAFFAGRVGPAVPTRRRVSVRVRVRSAVPLGSVGTVPRRQGRWIAGLQLGGREPGAGDRQSDDPRPGASLPSSRGCLSSSGGARGGVQSSHRFHP